MGSISTIFANNLIKIKEEETPNNGGGVVKETSGRAKWSHCSQKQFDDTYDYS